MKLFRKIAVGVTVGFAALWLAPGAMAQQAYPTKQIRLVVPWAAGNQTDLVARQISGRLSEALGQSVWIDNKPGASGQIGLEALRSADPDGYTIGIGGVGPMTVNPSLYDTLNYDPVKDFAPISMLWSGPMVLLVSPESGWKSVDDILKAAADAPNGIKYASPGNGTLQHIAGEMLKHYAKANLVHVPHRGSEQAISSVLGGHIQALFDTASAAKGQVDAGKLVALAVSTPDRTASLPDVPTFVESGYPDVSAGGWICLIAPAGVPAEVIDRLNAEVKKILAEPEIAEWGISRGGAMTYSTPEELGAFFKSEIDKWAAIVKAADIKVN